MYKHVLELDLGWLDNLERAKRKQYLPTVLSTREVREVLGQMTGTTRLMAALIYGTGLRVNECVQLRVKDIDFDLRTITVRSGKGGKDRVTLLPVRLVEPLRTHLLQIYEQHKNDCLQGAGFVPLPGALYKKYPKAAQSTGWQYVFPSTALRRWSQTGQTVRWHSSASTPQRAFREALRRTSITKHASIHTLRHCFATHLLQSGTDVRTPDTAWSQEHQHDHDLHAHYQG